MNPDAFDRHIDFARDCDSRDELAGLARSFEMPRGRDGRPQHYLCGHSLGLMPGAARQRVLRELDRWSGLGVGGHFAGEDGWYRVHERFAEPLAALLGVEASEVVAMNSLTVNLHLMLVSFFEPDARRFRILVEHGLFPSDRYAVRSQLKFHGLDPDSALIEFGADGSGIDPPSLEAALQAADGSVALVLLPGVQYLTGAAIDLPGCAAVARRHGCRLGLDLAHAIGNLDLDLRAAEPDFAVWCSYKYLNGGPGAIGGCFVNRRWAGDPDRPRFEGWWGHDSQTRFRAQPRFAPMAGAAAWQLSNPPVLAMVPLEASLELFGIAGIERLRRKSIALTGYLEWLLLQECDERIELLTPRAAGERGAQISLRLGVDSGRAERIVAALLQAGVCVDWRAPDIIRMAPVPLYNSFADVHAGVRALADALAA